MFWESESQPPPFTVDEPTALDFLGAVLASVVGTTIKRSVAVKNAVTVHIWLLLLSKDPAVAQFFPSVGMLAAYNILSSMYHSQIVPAPVPGSNALKHFANVVT
eukprot:6213110-Pleurochrysis_carterae.AAC.1